MRRAGAAVCKSPLISDIGVARCLGGVKGLVSPGLVVELVTVSRMTFFVGLVAALTNVACPFPQPRAAGIISIARRKQTMPQAYVRRRRSASTSVLLARFLWLCGVSLGRMFDMVSPHFFKE